MMGLPFKMYNMEDYGFDKEDELIDGRKRRCGRAGMILFMTHTINERILYYWGLSKAWVRALQRLRCGYRRRFSRTGTLLGGSEAFSSCNRPCIFTRHNYGRRRGLWGCYTDRLNWYHFASMRIAQDPTMTGALML